MQPVRCAAVRLLLPYQNVGQPAARPTQACVPDAGKSAEKSDVERLVPTFQR